MKQQKGKIIKIAFNVVFISGVIYVFFFAFSTLRSMQKNAIEAEPRMLIEAFSRGQQQYYKDNKEFADDLKELNQSNKSNISSTTSHYQLETIKDHSDNQEGYQGLSIQVTPTQDGLSYRVGTYAGGIKYKEEEDVFETIICRQDFGEDASAEVEINTNGINCKIGESVR